MRWADVMLQKVAAVVQDLQDEKEGRRLSEQILPQAEAFQAPAMKAPAMRGQVSARSAPATMFSEGDIGVLPPLGVWDPLGYIDSRDMRRYEEMEIKHGRAAMLGFLHVILTEAGLRFPGYLSDGTFGGAPIKFADVPAGAINTVLAIPGSSWAQIICLCGVLESGVFTQDPDREAGDIAPEWGPWVRYDDPEARTFKLNVERQNGRAAMLGRAGACLQSDFSGESDWGGPPMVCSECLVRSCGNQNRLMIVQQVEHFIRQSESWVQSKAASRPLDTSVLQPGRHHGHHPARAPGRGWPLPDGWPCVGGRSADHLLKPRHARHCHEESPSEGACRIERDGA